MKIAHATTHDSQIICTRPCGAFGVAHAHLLDARDEAVLMSRMSTQESRALSNKESLEEAPHPRLPANAELVELGPRLIPALSAKALAFGLLTMMRYSGAGILSDLLNMASKNGCGAARARSSRTSRTPCSIVPASCTTYHTPL